MRASALSIFYAHANCSSRFRNLDDGNCDRVHELSQRTNQLNYSGRAVTRTELDRLRHDPADSAGFVLSCRDKFGDYGIIGFAVVDFGKASVDHFFMSCRVQHKKVDHAFFGWLLERMGARASSEYASTSVPQAETVPPRKSLRR